MMVWIVLGMLAVAALCALLLPLTLSGHAQARGEPNGDWAVAGGLGLRPFAASFVAAPGITPLVIVHVFGRKLATFPVHHALRRVELFPRQASDGSLDRVVRDVARASELFERTIEVLLSDHRFRVESLDLSLDYSFRDVALTGRLLGALYGVAAVLPERISIQQNARWDAEDRFTLALDARVKLWPGRLALDLARFVLKRKHPVQVTEP